MTVPRYHCACGYTAEVASGERSAGGVRTATVVCSACRELVDVVSAAPEGAGRVGECPRCGSRYHRPWAGRACPRCARTMSRGAVE